MKNIIDEKYILDLKDLVELSSSLIYLGNYEDMAYLLDSSFRKNYYEYSKIIYNNLCSNKFTDNKIIFNYSIELTNTFNNLLFVVKDKEALIKNISEKGYIISQGSKQWRGQINSVNSFLNYLDTDFRKSLYNHSKLHYNKGNLNNNCKDEILTKNHFTFENIHKKMGNIRW